MISGRPIATFLLGFAALWFALEWVLFGLISSHIGWFLTIALSIAKGGIGLLLLGVVLRRMQMGFRDVLGSGAPFSVAEPLLAILGAILICLPGFVATLIGLALFAPSVRRFVIARFQTRQNPDFIDLGVQDYREIKS